MTKKIRFSLILVYCVAIILLFLPFMKQALVIYQTRNVSFTSIETTTVSERVPLEAVQPPDLADVAAFDTRQAFQTMGQIIIPEVEIGLPLFSGVANDQLLVGAGTLFPERAAENHNIVVIGHHLGRTNLLFGKLLNITVGDTIYLEYRKQFYQYRVSQTKLIKQTELQVLEDQKKAEITLITCDKPTQTDQRFVVKGELVRQPAQEIKQKTRQQKRRIQEKNQRKDLGYCIVVLIAFMLSILLGIRVIYKVGG